LFRGFSQVAGAGGAQSDMGIPADGDTLPLVARVDSHDERFGFASDADKQTVYIGIIALARLEGERAQFRIVRLVANPGLRPLVYGALR
jgi:hypothetical protein